MRPVPSTLFEEPADADSRLPRSSRRPPGLLQRLAARLTRRSSGSSSHHHAGNPGSPGSPNSPSSPNGSRTGGPAQSPSQASTLPPLSRGQALRLAHRTLRERMRAHPAVRQVLPHLAVIEKSLAKRGSRALLRLPVPVLQRGLEQLAVLQQDDESDAEAQQLRLLRLRLIEAISLRSGRGRRMGLGTDAPMGAELGAVSPLSDLRIPTADASDLSVSVFDEAEQDWQQRLLAQRLRRPH